MAVVTFTTDTISLSIPVKKSSLALNRTGYPTITLRPTYVFRYTQQKLPSPVQ